MSYHFGHFGAGGADLWASWGLVAEPMGLAHGGNVVNATGQVEGRGVTSTFLSLMIIHLSSY